jgi:hypothetical protein
MCALVILLSASVAFGFVSLFPLLYVVVNRSAHIIPNINFVEKMVQSHPC